MPSPPTVRYSLALIGGGVMLICQPTAVAEPVTALLLDRYTEWLAVEYGSLRSMGLKADRRHQSEALVAGLQSAVTSAQALSLLRVED